MRNNKLFDASDFSRWAKKYDQDVQKSDEDNNYPFAAYNLIQKALVNKAKEHDGKKAIDIGIGTGTLAEKLASLGYQITGIDFSEEMLNKARQRVPSARLMRWDFTQGLPQELDSERFDLAFCTYAIHHLNDKQKRLLIRQVMHLLNEEGLFLIADVITETKEEMQQVKKVDADLWDDEEMYLIVEDVYQWFPQGKVTFEKFSYCSGIISITK